MLSVKCASHRIYTDIKCLYVGGADVDNALSAVARMIRVDANAVPLNLVLPVMLSSLPLRADHSEGPNIYGALIDLIVQGNNNVMNPGIMSQLLTAFGQVIAPNSPSEDRVKAEVLSALKFTASSPNHQNLVMESLNAIMDQNIKVLLTTAINS
jgi:hypothetical protein